MLNLANSDEQSAAELPVISSSSTPVERIGAPLYSDRWPNTKVAKIAAMVAKGYSCTAISAELDDGTAPNEISAMAWKWGLTVRGLDTRRTYAVVPVELAAKFRTDLAAEAKRRGMELPQLLQKVAETLCRDRLFGAVLD